MSTNRLEAFSDGVLAVAITLLVLDIRVPPQSGRLGHELLNQWPQYAAYATSFTTIGIIWINHHVMINRLRITNRAILTLNLGLLLSIGLLPFATSLMAAYLKESRGEHLAALVYSGAFLLMSILFVALNAYILFARHSCLRTDLPPERRRQIILRGAAGIVPYALATALAPVSPYITLAICAAIAGFYALPIGSGGGVD